jgi:putative ABC transport system substrate-binding protein
MKRRGFVTMLGGAIAGWPPAVFAQQQNRMRLVGAISGIADESTIQTRYAVFLQELQKLGWTDGRNVRVVYHYGGGDLEDTRRQVAELVALAPDVILASGGPATERLLQATRSIPIVFVIVPDPVGSGLVARLSRPGGNATGFIQFEYSLAGKWLELLKQIARPREIEAAFETVVSERIGALVVSGENFFLTQHSLMIQLAARHVVPTIYAAREFVLAGGLMSYGTPQPDGVRQVGGYTGRILQGEKAADLPVQQITKIELAINLKTAKALGLTIPPALLARADEVIE